MMEEEIDNENVEKVFEAYLYNKYDTIEYIIGVMIYNTELIGKLSIAEKKTIIDKLITMYNTTNISVFESKITSVFKTESFNI